MKIRVNPHNVEIVREQTEPINELEVNVSKCEFEFDEKITNEFVKEAYFTLNGNTYKQIIVNNECDYPNEVLTEKGTLEIGVVAYKVENEEEIIRYNPSPDYYDTWEGSLKDAENVEPLTPTDKEQMQSQISQNTSDISDLQANKQDKLTAGANITIDENNVISAVDTIYDDTEIKADIQELQETKIDKDVNNLTYYTLTTETGSKITLSIDSLTYVMTLKLKDKNNNDISTANVDLPLETMVVGARYDSATKEIVLTLKNGQEVRFSVADLVSGLQTEITENNKLSSDLVDDTNQTHKFTSTNEKNTWNAKYDKPSNGIPKSDLVASVQESLNKADTAIQDVSDKEDKSNKVTEINSSSTDTQYPSAKCVYDSQEEQNEQIAELEMLYNAFPTVSAEDTTIQLDNTAKVKFREIDLKGNTSQVVIPEEQGTTVSNTSIYVSDVNTDKESSIEMSGNTYQDSTTGKNLLPPTLATDPNYTKGTTTTYDSNTGYYTTTGTTTNTYPWLVDANVFISTGATLTISSNSSYRIYARLYYNSSSYEEINSVTTPTKTVSNDIIRIAILSNTPKDTQVNETYYVQIEEGSTATTFEKFTYGASPNPDYPQPIDVVTGNNNVVIKGKNYAESCNGIWFNGTAFKYYTQAQGYGFKAEIKPNTTYTISKKNASNRFSVIIGENDIVNNNSFSRILIQEQDTNRTTYTFTSQENEKYVFFGVYRGTNETEIASACEDVQIEEGSTATTYEPYVSQTYPINLGNIELCKIDTYQDRIYKQNDKWYLYKEIGKVILNGTQTTIARGTSTTGYNRFAIDIGTNIYMTSNTTEIAPFYCNEFIPITRTNSYANINGIFPGVESSFDYYRSLGIYYDATKEMTSQQFQTWLSQNNVIVYYPYATPTTTEITDTTLVNQLNALYNATIYPITNINTDTSNLLPYIDLHYNFVTPSPSPSRPSVVNVVKGNNTITISNSDNTESQNYPINLGDMEICKIGTYQDYIYESNGNWFKKSNINKVTFNGSEENWARGTIQDYYRYTLSLDTLVSADAVLIYSNYYRCISYNNRNSDYFNTIYANGNIGINTDVASTLTEWKSWLSNNNLTAYYVLATPTDTQITDTTLITQLNNIKKAYSYDSQTNINQTNTDKPFIIYAEAIRSLKDVFE